MISLSEFINDNRQDLLMASEIDDVISMASAMFPESVIKIMERAKFSKEDINALTREDVDNEFREFRFGIRKSLWMFFSSFKTNLASNQHQESGYIALTSTQNDPNAQIVLDPVRSMEDILDEVADTNQNDKEHSPKPPKQTIRLDNQIQEWDIGRVQDVVTTTKQPKSSTPRARSKKHTYSRLNPGEQIPSYPCNIESPFPLNDAMKEYLDDITYIHINELKSLYNQFVREVYRVLERHSDDTLSLDDIRITARNLCEEYACLLNNGSYSTLYSSLRKKRNNTRSWRRSVANDQEKSFDSSKEEIHPDLTKIPPYPLGLPTPFPLNSTLSKLLKSEKVKSRKNFRRTYYDVVKAVVQVLELKLGGKASLHTLSAVAQNLCKEYPILATGDVSKKGGDFYYSLRKCSNYRAQRTRIPLHVEEPRKNKNIKNEDENTEDENTDISVEVY